jgi:uncharacterized membrane protein YadS
MNNQKSIAGLLIGGGLVLYAIILKIGYLNDVLKYLGQAKTIDVHSGVALWVGMLVLLIGILNFIVPVGKFKHDSIVRAPAPGIGIIILLCILNRYYLEPIFKIWGKALQPALGFDFATIFGFNYILLGILIGILWVNIIKIPAWMLPGVKTGRLILKMGIITLGAMYSITELKYMGSLSIIMVFAFVMGTVFFVLWFGKIFKTEKPLTGVLASGLGVCGVSAAVAVAPVVKARGIDMAYSIGMLLLVGVVGLFVFPPVGKAVGMNEIQFGAWAGTGILNSAQVAAAALVFDPHTIETLKVAEIFNITRVLILPLIVIVLALWFAKGEAAENVEKLNVGKILIDKFPIFVIGFILMFTLMSVGFFTPKGFELHGKNWYNLMPSEKKQLKKEELAKIKDFVDSGAVTSPMVKEALEKLLVDKQITSTTQADYVLKAQDFTKDKELKKLFKDADKKVHGKPITIEIMREYMLWFFAYGLIALGMQITWQTMKQAGGKAAVIGAITGFLKAFLAFWVCLFLLKETI